LHHSNKQKSTSSSLFFTNKVYHYMGKFATQLYNKKWLKIATLSVTFHF